MKQYIFAFKNSAWIEQDWVSFSIGCDMLLSLSCMADNLLTCPRRFAWVLNFVRPTSQKTEVGSRQDLWDARLLALGLDPRRSTTKLSAQAMRWTDSGCDSR